MKKKTKISQTKIVKKVISLKKLTNKKLSVQLAILVLVVAALGFGYYRFWNVAIVNGKAISRINYIRTMEKQGGKQVLDRMIQEAMIRDEAQKKGVKIEQAVIDGEMKKIETQVVSMGQTLEEALLGEGITKEELEDQIRMQKMVELMANANVEITQAQIDEFVAENKDQFPKGTTNAEMQTAAKQELAGQAGNEAINKWLGDLNTNAKIVYK